MDQNQDNKKRNELDPTVTVKHAAPECHQEETGAKNIAQQRVNKRRIVTGRKGNVTSTNTKRNSVTVTCGFCGNEFSAKTKRARYCNAVCRREAWLLRNPDRAAELAESDKARLRLHLESKGIAWVESGDTVTDENEDLT